MTTLEDLNLHHAATQVAYDDAERHAAQLHRMIAEALADGISAVDIAETLGVTRARVYQLRDKAK